MKKLVIGAVAAVLATLSLSTVADARPQWQHRGWNHGGWHHGWRHDGWRGGYRGGWRGGYWGGPRVVIGLGVGPGYCFVKKVRHIDRHGDVYLTRVRVCR